MNFSLNSLWQKLAKQIRNNTPKTLSEYNHEVILKQGREQFKKLADKGLVPIALL